MHSDLIKFLQLRTLAVLLLVACLQISSLAAAKEVCERELSITGTFYFKILGSDGIFISDSSFTFWTSWPSWGTGVDVYICHGEELTFKTFPESYSKNVCTPFNSTWESYDLTTRKGELISEADSLTIDVPGHYYLSGTQIPIMINVYFFTPRTDVTYSCFPEPDTTIVASVSNPIGASWDFSQDVQLYPNPATSLLNVGLRSRQNLEAQYHLIDAQGRVLKSAPIQLSQESKKIDISDYPQGVYFLKVQHGQEVTVKRLLITI